MQSNYMLFIRLTFAVRPETRFSVDIPAGFDSTAKPVTPSMLQSIEPLVVIGFGSLGAQVPERMFLTHTNTHYLRQWHKWRGGCTFHHLPLLFSLRLASSYAFVMLL